METWLLSWNPALSYEDPKVFARTTKRVRRGSGVLWRWSCGRATRIAVGDRVFMMKLGRGKGGIFASGVVIRKPAKGGPWVGKQTSGGSMYVEFKLDAMLDVITNATEVFDVEHAGQLLASHVWRQQSSGTRVPANISVELERRWQSHYRRISGATPAIVENDALASQVNYDEAISGFEGALLRRYVLHRKRERRFRSAKLAQAKAAGGIVCEVPG